MPVQRRHVFYLGGFDPNGPAHYHRMYREQAALQSVVSGQRLHVGPRKTLAADAAGWRIRSHAADGAAVDAVETDLTFLRWDDIVRQHWARSPPKVALDTLAAGWLLLRTGALMRILGLSWPAFVALASPLVLLLCLIAGLPLLAWLLADSAATLSGSRPVGLLAAGLGVGGALAMAARAERRLHMQWLMRSTRFHARQAAGRLPELEARLDRFADELCRQAKAAAVDEILIVGHSSGSMMAVSVLARALARDPQLALRGPQISLVTLGHCMPVLSSLPRARRFRDELRTISTAHGIDWVDFTAPPDGCCFALCDPIEAAGLPRADRIDHPKLLSPRFAVLFSPETYAQIRRDRFRLHFQYVMASELPGAYDYFAITAGPMTLAERFADQASVRDFTSFRRFAALSRGKRRR